MVIANYLLVEIERVIIPEATGMMQDILTLIHQGYSLVTPTSRLSRHLSNHFAQVQLSQGKQAWESPSILPWSAWLENLQRQLVPERENETYILNPHQQINLWTGIIRESEYSQQLLQVTSVARQVMQAWELVHQWQLPLFPGDIYINQDAYAFQYWADCYLKTCEERGWMDEARFPDLVARQLQGVQGCAALKCVFVGFDEIYPQQSSLLENLRSQGAEIVVHETRENASRVQSVTFTDELEEINAVANWARTVLTSGEDETIGIIIPGLAQSRGLVMDALDDVLMSENVLKHEDPENRPYSVALGQPLSRYPLIVTAFRILQLLHAQLSLEDISGLVLSPWIKGAEHERSSRYQLDANLRDFGQQQFTSSQALQLIEFFCEQSSGCETLLESFAVFKAESPELSGKHSARDWIVKIKRVLEIFGWPGERSLNSLEYQTVEAWRDMLLQFSSLDMVTSKLDAGAVVSQLSQLALSYSFQGESAETRLQVLSPGAAAGMHFDHLWMLGMHEDAWPVAMEANPFIPLALQKSHELPFASAELRLARGQRLTAALLNSGDNVVVSYACFDADREQRPSATLRQYFANDAEMDLHYQDSYRDVLFASSKLEYLADTRGTSLAQGEYARGGSALFKDQAACPFRAYAKHRLFAQGLGEADIGLNAAERGMLVHEVMQQFFEQVPGHSDLVEMTGSTQDALIDSSLQGVMQKYRRFWPHILTPAFVEVESSRLKRLALEWLELEKQRDPFKVVGLEQKQKISFAGVEINTRIDRIDQLDDGRLVLIDYKTGSASPSAWFGSRPDDPQLPLYVISQDREVAALVFGKLTSSELKFSGIAADDGLLPGVKVFHASRGVQHESWEQVISDWRVVLGELGNEFRGGEAAVNPKNEMSCRYCDLHSFCRISEQQYRLSDEESH